MSLIFMLCLHIQDDFRKIRWLKSINTSLKMASNQLGYSIKDILTSMDSENFVIVVENPH